MKLTIYHNPRCSKSRQTLQILEEKGQETDVIHYLETPPSVMQLSEIIEKLGISPRDLLRKGEEVYKVLQLSDSELKDAQLIEAMVANPILIERPIVFTDKGAAIGRPPERVLELFD